MSLNVHSVPAIVNKETITELVALPLEVQCLGFSVEGSYLCPHWSLPRLHPSMNLAKDWVLTLELLDLLDLLRAETLYFLNAHTILLHVGSLYAVK